ncbi:MAG: Clp protease N-terminal domain-containing protein [Bacteroidota bacterium]
MLQYSIGARLAWEISSYEASNKDSTFIEIDHIMIGILSMEKILNQIRLNSEQEYEQLNIEKEKLYKILYSFKLDTLTLRRKLRDMIPKGDGKPKDMIFHRSSSCKKMFDDATSLANNYITIKHLFVAIINRESSYFHRLLTDLNVNIDGLRSEIMFSFYTQN